MGLMMAVALSTVAYTSGLVSIATVIILHHHLNLLGLSCGDIKFSGNNPCTYHAWIHGSFNFHHQLTPQKNTNILHQDCLVECDTKFGWYKPSADHAQIHCSSSTFVTNIHQ